MTSFASLQMPNASRTWVNTDIEAEGGGLAAAWDHINNLPSKGYYGIVTDTHIEIWCRTRSWLCGSGGNE